MRLNFSGVNEDEIREGVRRIGEVVREQVALYGTLTGARAASPRRTERPPAVDEASPDAAAESELAKVLHCGSKRTQAG